MRERFQNKVQACKYNFLLQVKTLMEVIRESMEDLFDEECGTINHLEQDD